MTKNIQTLYFNLQLHILSMLEMGDPTHRNEQEIGGHEHAVFLRNLSMDGRIERKDSKRGLVPHQG
jgi:hypothetical protein